jgi:uncharacterized protein YutE (UPF0331/DUF86 family)
VVDKAVLAKRIAGIRDAVARIKFMLPATTEEFSADRTVREVVILNLFVALQDTLSLAVHWLADEGADVPQAYRDVFRTLGERGVLPVDLATRLAAASGLRNLVAHQYGTLDWTRIHTIAATELDDLLLFCRELAQRAERN